MSQSHEKQLMKPCVSCAGERKVKFLQSWETKSSRLSGKRLLRSLNWQRFRTGSIWMKKPRLFIAVRPYRHCSVSAWTEKALCTSRMVPRCFMPARIWIGIWRPERSRRMSRASDFFYKFQGIPLSVGTELGVSLGGPQACMPHQLADGVQRDILTGQPRAKGMSQGVDNDFEPGIGDTIVQAKNVYGLRKGMGQGIGSDLKSFCRSEDEIGWSDWDNGLR